MFCIFLVGLAGEGHSYVATWWRVNSQGNITAQIQLRAVLSTSRAKFRRMKKEAVDSGHQFGPIIRPIFKSDRVKRSSASKIMNLPGHAMTSTTDQHISSTVKAVACLVDQGSGWTNLVASSNS